MQEVIKILIGIVILILAFPIGDLLKKITDDEQKAGQKWFLILTYIGLIGGLVGLFLVSDWMIFTFLFIAIVSSRSLIVRKVRPTRREK